MSGSTGMFSVAQILLVYKQSGAWLQLLDGRPNRHLMALIATLRALNINRHQLAMEVTNTHPTRTHATLC